MITNPQPVIVRESDEDNDEQPRTSRGKSAIITTRRFRQPNHDADVDRIMTEVSTKIIDVNAKLRERGPDGKWFYQHYPTFKKLRESKTFWNRVQDHYSIKELKEVGENLLDQHYQQRKQLMVSKRGIVQDGSKKLREASFQSDEFTLGSYPDEISGNTRVFPIQDTFLPSTNSPYAKQQLWVDYQAMHARCFEAATKNPIAKRIVRIIHQFVLGRGVVSVVKQNKGQEAWNTYFKNNGMKLRMKRQLDELVIFGEIFNRFFKAKEGSLAIRAIDPSTIWDIITNPEDLEEVIYYHQQYVVTMNSPVPGVNALVPATLIIRQIPAEEIDHFKINSTSSEKRGRSELYAILGWLLRFKEFANDRVLINKMKSMFALDVKVTGDVTDVQAAEAQFATPPGPGSVAVHNEAVEIDFKNTNANAQDASTDGDMLLKIIAIGAGVSEHFLGVSKNQTRAGALISTEPDVKNFEDYQEIVEDMLDKQWERVKVRAGLQDTLAIEHVFPSIAQEDRSGKLKDIITAEAADYFSKARAASMSAREFNISTYDYEKEKEDIRKEREGDFEQMMPADNQQVPKMAPDPIEQEKEKAKLYGIGGEEEDQEGVTQLSGQMGFDDAIGGRSLPDTAATLNRSGFTRGEEKERVKGNKSTGKKSKGDGGTPLRHSLRETRTPGPEVTEKEESVAKGWSPKARAAATVVRRRKKLERLERMREAATNHVERTGLEREISILREKMQISSLVEGSS
jgi:hypothetical protein